MYIHNYRTQITNLIAYAHPSCLMSITIIRKSVRLILLLHLHPDLNGLRDATSERNVHDEHFIRHTHTMPSDCDFITTRDKN